MICKALHGWLSAAIALGLLCACADASGPDSDPTGTYTLQKVNDIDLPHVLKQEGNYKLEVLIGSLRIHEDSTFVRSTTSREIDGATTRVETEQTRGTWTRQGDSLTFRVEGVVDNIASIKDRDIIVVLDSMKFEYRR